MASIDLSVIIVSWNSADHLAVCLESLHRNLDGIGSHVIVVDNGSQDHWKDVVDLVYPDAKVIQNSDNQGFAAAVNQGIEIAEGEFVLILNPDAFLHGKALKSMVSVLREHSNIGIVGPRVVDQNGVIVPVCKRKKISLVGILKNAFLGDRIHQSLLRLTAGTRLGGFLASGFSKSGSADCIQGSCMMMRKRDLDRLGLFDARVPLYLDDNDICARFAKAGLKTHYCAYARVVHHGGASVGILPNPRMTSLIRHLAHDVYFLKHRNWFHVLGHHAILGITSILHLLGDALLFPFVAIVNRRFITQYIVMHFWTLVYAVSFRFRTQTLPASWPRSLFRVFRKSKGK